MVSQYAIKNHLYTIGDALTRAGHPTCVYESTDWQFEDHDIDIVGTGVSLGFGPNGMYYVMKNDDGSFTFSKEYVVPMVFLDVVLDVLEQSTTSAAS